MVASGHDVAVLDDLSTGYADNVPARAELFEGDVADADMVAKAVAGAEVVSTWPPIGPCCGRWRILWPPTWPTPTAL